MKKSAVLVLIFTFMVLGGFYFSSKRPDSSVVPTSTIPEVTPTATVSAKPSTNPTIKPATSSAVAPTITVTATPAPKVDGKMTLDQVATHNSKKDCYIVIKNNVYDVSTFIPDHPGSPGKIISKCGQEVTGIFAEIHSNSAWDLLAKYKIGQI